MSRGFVKEDDLEHAGTDIPERAISPHANYVTVNGYKQLEKEANTLELQRKQFSAKKDDQTVAQQLTVINRNLRYVSARLKSALITVPDAHSQVVVFGAIVTVEDDEGQQHSYSIVGEDEADIKLNKVSWTSPLASALIGQKVGDSVVWARPAGNISLEIIHIKF